MKIEKFYYLFAFSIQYLIFFLLFLCFKWNPVRIKLEEFMKIGSFFYFNINYFGVYEEIKLFYILCSSSYLFVFKLNSVLFFLCFLR